MLLHDQSCGGLGGAGMNAASWRRCSVRVSHECNQGGARHDCELAIRGSPVASAHVYIINYSYYPCWLYLYPTFTTGSGGTGRERGAGLAAKCELAVGWLGCLVSRCRVRACVGLGPGGPAASIYPLDTWLEVQKLVWPALGVNEP